MNSDPSKYDEIIIKGILHTNQFDIKEVKALEGIWSGYFNEGKLKELDDLIKAGDLKAIEKVPGGGDQELGFIDLFKFKDQGNQDYLVTVYEGYQYWDDPEIVEIYRI
jgi:hypothetical protein